MKPTDFAAHLTAFLTNYLAGQRNLSPNTIKSYRDTFVLFLRYCRDKRNWYPESIMLKKIDQALLLSFLDSRKLLAFRVSKVTVSKGCITWQLMQMA